jgi:hypothetical protein
VTAVTAVKAAAATAVEMKAAVIAVKAVATAVEID